MVKGTMRTTKSTFISSALIGAIAVSILIGSATLSTVCAADITPAEIKTIAEEGFIYGLPIVMNYAVMYEYAVDKNSGQYKAPFNQIKNEARVYTYKDTAIVTPNSDTPYSLMFMDLRAEPIVLSVPAVEKSRYYAVMLCDGNTFNYGYIGSRATGPDSGDYLVVGPDWKGETPAGIKKVFHSSTQFSLAVYRTQLFNPEDMPNVVKIQSGYKAQPLSTYLRQPAPPAAPGINFPKINKELVKTNFFEYLGFALQFAPPGPDEKEIRAKLASIGKDLSPEQKAAVAEGMKEGEAKVEDGVKHLGTKINGWNIASITGDRAFFNGDWLKRAEAAKAGIYGNDAVEAMYPLTTTLANGEPLDGSKNKYTLTFPAGEFPPVNAFWSVTMYDGKTQVADQEPDQPLPYQLTHAAEHEEERRRFAHALHPEGFARRGQGIQLAPCAERHDLSRLASLLAEDRSAFDSSAR